MRHLTAFWETYARLQDDLTSCHRIDDKVWGLEAALDRLVATNDQQVLEEDLDRVRQSKSRRERARGRLRRACAMAGSVFQEAESIVDARERLAVVIPRATEDDMALLLSVDAGVEYDELATELGVSVGCLRTRVCRLRSKLRESLGDGDPGQARLVVRLAAA